MTNQFLTFNLDNCLYAFKVFKVQEVLTYTTPVKVPCSSSYVEGLINSRDTGISVIDLRKKFKLQSKEPDKESRIIVVEGRNSSPSIEKRVIKEFPLGRLSYDFFKTGVSTPLSLFTSDNTHEELDFARLRTKLQPCFAL